MSPNPTRRHLFSVRGWKAKLEIVEHPDRVTTSVTFLRLGRERYLPELMARMKRVLAVYDADPRPIETMTTDGQQLTTWGNATSAFCVITPAAIKNDA